MRERAPRLRRGARSGKQGRKARRPRKLVSEREHVLSHPLFGAIPLRPRSQGGGFDLDYRPRLPPGAVRGEPHKQNGCFHVPRYFYVDQRRSCVDCGRGFVFTAVEQKRWYEELSFHLDAKATRCACCRRRRRAERALRRRLREAVDAWRSGVRAPSEMLELGRATVEHHERFGEGGLDRAIGALRAAAKTPSHRSEAVYWEGRAQLASGRREKGAEVLRRFLLERGNKGAGHVDDVRQRLLELESGERGGR